MRRVLTPHVAQTMKQRFAAALAPLNLCIGVEGGLNFTVMSTQFGIDKFVTGLLKTPSGVPSRVAILLDLRNMFNKVLRNVLMAKLDQTSRNLSCLPICSLARTALCTSGGRTGSGSCC